MRRWTKEERERQASIIQGWKPWEQSTGPATPEGKAISASNALKHGMRSAEWIAEKREINALMRKFRESADKVGV